MTGERGSAAFGQLPPAANSSDSMAPRRIRHCAVARPFASALIRAAAAAVLSMPCALPVPAVEPHEILDDPVLESRAREISRNLRCLVCRNENIDSSNAELAADLRLLVRERLTAGDGDEEILEYVTDRYGEYVLLYPRPRGANLLLWAAGPIVLLAGAAFLVRRQLRRAAPKDQESLDGEEKRRVAELIGD